ncbi:hypothetical protein pb186bvf_006933 [Paramecium bursaria]
MQEIQQPQQENEQQDINEEIVDQRLVLIQRIDQLLIIIERLKQQRWKMELLRQMFLNIETGGEIDIQLQQILRKDIDELDGMYTKQEEILQILVKRQDNSKGYNVQSEQERLMSSYADYELKSQEFLLKIKGQYEQHSILNNYLSQYMNKMDEIQGIINEQK